MLTRTSSGVMVRVGRSSGWHVGRGPCTCGVVWSMAVGVVVVPVACTRWAREDDRLALALGAYKRGFYLLDLLDVPVTGEVGTAWAPVWSLAARTTADAVVVYTHDRIDVPCPPKGRRLPVHVITPEK
jgi:hypothetical protein